MDRGKSFYALLLTLLLVSFAVNVAQYLQRDKGKVVIDGDTITVVSYEHRKDTIPSVKSEKVTGHVSIPVLSNSSKIGNDVKKSTDSIHTDDAMYKKTENLYIDSTEVELDIVQRMYSDSTYTAYVSGIKVDEYPKLDSIIVRGTTIIQVVTKTEKKKGVRFKFRPAIGVGYGLTLHKADIWAGGSLLIDF